LILSRSGQRRGPPRKNWRISKKKKIYHEEKNRGTADAPVFSVPSDILVGGKRGGDVVEERQTFSQGRRAWALAILGGRGIVFTEKSSSAFDAAIFSTFCKRTTDPARSRAGGQEDHVPAKKADNQKEKG